MAFFNSKIFPNRQKLSFCYYLILEDSIKYATKNIWEEGREPMLLTKYRHQLRSQTPKIKFKLEKKLILIIYFLKQKQL